MKKTLLFLLSFVLVFALCSCKGAGNNVSVSEENVVSGSVEKSSASTENVSKEDDGTKSEEPQKDEEVTDDEKGNGDESGTSDDDGYHGDVIKEDKADCRRGSQSRKRNANAL